MNKRIISANILTKGASKYNYCPYCLKEWFGKGGDNKYAESLPTLKHVTTAQPVKQEDGTYSDIIDDHYECIKCGRNMTENTFVMFYCCRADGTKYTEPPREPGKIWSREKNCFVPARWDVVKRIWIELDTETESE